MALAMASWIAPSSRVGEFLQYFVPKSRRLMHRQTIFFWPLFDQVTLR
jgi:hypothetical protein